MTYPKRATSKASQTTHQRDHHHDTVQTPITSAAAWESASAIMPNASKLPALFISHGAPTLAIEQSATTSALVLSSLCRRIGNQQSSRLAVTRSQKRGMIFRVLRLSFTIFSILHQVNQRWLRHLLSSSPHAVSHVASILYVPVIMAFGHRSDTCTQRQMCLSFKCHYRSITIALLATNWARSSRICVMRKFLLRPYHPQLASATLGCR